MNSKIKFLLLAAILSLSIDARAVAFLYPEQLICSVCGDTNQIGDWGVYRNFGVPFTNSVGGYTITNTADGNGLNLVSNGVVLYTATNDYDPATTNWISTTNGIDPPPQFYWIFNTYNTNTSPKYYINPRGLVAQTNAYVFFVTNCGSSQLWGVYNYSGFSSGTATWANTNTPGQTYTLTTNATGSRLKLGNRSYYINTSSGDPTSTSWAIVSGVGNSPKPLVLQLVAAAPTNAVTVPTNSVSTGTNFGIAISSLPRTNTLSDADLFIVNSTTNGGTNYITKAIKKIDLQAAVGSGVSLSSNQTFTARNIFQTGSSTFAGQFQGPVIFGTSQIEFGLGDSLTQNLRINGVASQGGYTNPYSSGNFTNGYLFIPVGSYAENNISYLGGETNILSSRGVNVRLDLAMAFPGARTADMWGIWNGSNYVSLTSLQATRNVDQVNGFTYNSTGFYTNNSGAHGDPLPLTWWPTASDVYLKVQSIVYSNLNNTPISITVTGTSYAQFIFYGTATATTTAKVTLPYRAGQGSSSKYIPPYTSACDAFNLTENLPTILWALSNSPYATGIPSIVVLQSGNNDYGITTNAEAIWAVQTNVAAQLHAWGHRVRLVSVSCNPNSQNASGTFYTNLYNFEASQWQNWFDEFYDMQGTNAALGLVMQNSNYMDGTHFRTPYATTNSSRMVWATKYSLIQPVPLAAGAGGIHDASQLSNFPPSVVLADGSVPFTGAVNFPNGASIANGYFNGVVNLANFASATANAYPSNNIITTYGSGQGDQWKDSGVSAVNGGMATTNTATLTFTAVSALTNTLGYDGTASLSAGTSVVLKDSNGTTIDTIGTVATLHVVIPMRANYQLSGTAISAKVY